MELAPDGMTLKYSVRCFQDDFFSLFGYLSHIEMHKGRSQKDIFADTTLIPKYFRNNLKISCDNIDIIPKLINQDYQETEVWLHYTATIPKIPENMTIENKIYCQLFADQINMLIFSYKKKEVGLTFDISNTTKKIDLNNI